MYHVDLVMIKPQLSHGMDKCISLDTVKGFGHIYLGYHYGTVRFALFSVLWSEEFREL